MKYEDIMKFPAAIDGEVFNTYEEYEEHLKTLSNIRYAFKETDEEDNE